MAIAFPSSPIVGDEFTAAGKTWVWNGAQWEGLPAQSGIPGGTTDDRPASPSIGDQFYNGTLGVLEIYTSSGWLAATGANDFNIAITATDTSVTFNKDYFAGAYTITSSLADSTFDIYLLDSNNQYAGYSNTPSIVATQNFNKVVVIGGTAGDLLSFAYKTTFTSASEDSITTVGPVLVSVSPTYMNSVDASTTVTGKNFATDVQVTLTGTDGIVRYPKSVVRSSPTQLIITRPDDFPENIDPYTIVVTNPGINSPAGSMRNRLTNSITSGATPVWQTAAAITNFALSSVPYSQQLSATDPDGGSVTYSVVSGSLPTGLSMNSSGAITGTPATNPSGSSSPAVTVRATDTGGNYIDRQFTIPWYSSVSNIPVDTIVSSYSLLYRIATSSAEAFANVSRLQGYGATINATLTNSGKATNSGSWGGPWPLNVSQNITEGKMFVGIQASDDGDSSASFTQLNENGNTTLWSVGSQANINNDGYVAFRGANIAIGGGSVGSIYVKNVWTLTAP